MLTNRYAGKADRVAGESGLASDYKPHTRSLLPMESPKISLAQRIGSLGKKAFFAGIPDAWHEEAAPTQGGDFGFDGSMWLEEDGQIVGRFSVQLKAEVDPVPSKGEPAFYTVELTSAQCNTYISDGQPVMAVHIALTGESARGATLRFAWITDEIQKRLNGRLTFDDARPAKMTFRVPADNILDHGVDIGPYVKEHWNINRLVGKLRSPHGKAALTTVAGLTPAALGQIGRAESLQLSNWLTRADIDSDVPWFTPKGGSIQDDIRRLAEAISRGDSEEADRLVKVLSSRCDGSEVDLEAEYAFQQGRLASIKIDPQGALTHYARALDLLPDSPRYLAAALEASIRDSLDLEQLPKALVEKAETLNHPAVIFQRVRIAALRGDMGTVAMLLLKLDGANRYKAEILSDVIAARWLQAVALADGAMASSELDLHSQCFITILRVRAQLHIVLAGQDEIPMGGIAEFNVEQARLLKTFTLDALRRAQRAGWPANSEMIMDAAVAVTIMFGPDSAVFDLTREYARERPSVFEAQEALARVAATNNEPEIAIEALERLPSNATNRVERLVMLHAEVGSAREAVRLAMQLLVPLPHTFERDLAVLAATGAAVKLGAIVEEQALRLHLSHGDTDPGVNDLLRYMSAIWASGHHRNDVELERLFQRATENGGSAFLADNVLLHLKPNRSEDVPRIIAVAKLILERRSLNESESGKYAAALLEDGQLSEVVKFVDRALLVYPASENLGVSHALALDRMGQAAAASVILGRFASTTRVDVLQVHSQLHLRAGRLEEALSLIQEALSNCNDRAQRVHFLRLMATLQSTTDPAAYFETIWRLGEVVDRNNEIEESCFLCHFMMAAIGVPSADPKRVAHVHERIAIFSKLFPESKRFRVGSLPEGGKPEDLIAGIRSLSGMSDADVARYYRAVRLGEHAGSQIPLAMRPRIFTPFAQDIVHLFQIVIEGRYRGEASRLRLSQAKGSTALTSAPILDLVSLLALIELDLFDKLFDLWTAIAVPQSSLAHLSELQISPLQGVTGVYIKQATTAVRKWSERILQPQVPCDEPYPASESATITSEVRAGRFQYLTLDQAAAVWTKCSESATSLWDLLDQLREHGAVTEGQCSQVRLRVASWNGSDVPLSPEDVLLGMRGEAADALNHDKPLYHCVATFLRDTPSFVSVTQVIADLSCREADNRALGIFVSAVYREGLFLGTMRTRAGLTAARWTALAAALIASILRPKGDIALDAMRRSWSALKESYRQYDQVNEGWDALYDELGQQLARVLDKLVKSSGVQAIAIEEELRALVFSLTEAGTSERDRVEATYFAATAAINSH